MNKTRMNKAKKTLIFYYVYNEKKNGEKINTKKGCIRSFGEYIYLFIYSRNNAANI